MFYNESELIRNSAGTCALAVFLLGPRRSLLEEEMAFILEARLLRRQRQMQSRRTAWEAYCITVRANIDQMA